MTAPRVHQPSGSDRFATRRRLLRGAALALPAWAGTATPWRAHAQGSRSYAVLTELARNISVVWAQPEIGTRLGANHVDRIAIPDRGLDKSALVLTRLSLTREQPNAPVWLIAPIGEDLFPGFDTPFVGAKLSLPTDLADAMKQKGSTHLVLVTPQRTEARFQFLHSKAGSGFISGLGFYIDNSDEVRTVGGANALGYMAAFVSLRASVIEVGSARLVASQPAYKHRVQAVSASDTSVQNAWQAMSSERKVKTLSTLMEQAIEEAVGETIRKL